MQKIIFKNQLLKLIPSITSLTVVMLFQGPASAQFLINPFDAINIDSNAIDSSDVTSSIPPLSPFNNERPNSNTSNSTQSSSSSPFVSGGGSANQSNNDTTDNNNSETDTSGTGTSETGTSETGTSGTGTSGTGTSGTGTSGTGTSGTGTSGTGTSGTGTSGTGTSETGTSGTGISETGSGNSNSFGDTNSSESDITDLTQLASMLADVAVNNSEDNSQDKPNMPLTTPDKKKPTSSDNDPTSIPEPSSIVALTVMGFVGLLTQANQKTHK
jgi:hypothetical protein